MANEREILGILTIFQSNDGWTRFGLYEYTDNQDDNLWLLNARDRITIPDPKSPNFVLYSAQWSENGLLPLDDPSSPASWMRFFVDHYPARLTPAANGQLSVPRPFESYFSLKDNSISAGWNRWSRRRR